MTEHNTTFKSSGPDPVVSCDAVSDDFLRPISDQQCTRHVLVAVRQVLSPEPYRAVETPSHS